MFVGCHRDDSAPFPDWVPAQTVVARRGAFAELRQAGIEAEAAVRGLQRRAAPSSREVREMDARLGPLLDVVAKDCELPVVDDYVPSTVLAPDSSRIGWAALGGAFERRLHAAMVRQDYVEAVRVTSVGTRFALIIACGDADDALVGYPIADSLRRIIAPALRDLPPEQLSKLAGAIASALRDRLPPSVRVAHERLAMLGSLQAVQDAYRDGRLQPIADAFGPTARDAFDALDGFKGRHESRRAAFFEAVAGDIETEATWLGQAAVTPASQRAPEPTPKLTGKQPWHALARHLALAGGAMLDAGDLTIARSRLFALTCDLYAMAKTSGAVPRDLHVFPAELNDDPYTDKPFFYVPEGLDFILYSAGPDGVDNGGDTDDTGTRPDLKLEGTY